MKMTADPGQKLLPSFFVVLFLFGIGAFYVPLLGAYFASDDIPWIWFSATKSAWQIFFVPEQYRAIIGSNFTPMLGLSYKIDWLLFGMDPTGYFVHNLVAVVLAATAFFLLVRHYSNNAAGLAGAALFPLNPLALSVFSWCATRHYTEGMFFALMALYLHLKKSGAGRVSILSVLFYLVSALYKETYVVLPAILFLITRGGITRRMRNTLPFWAVLVIYFLWRFWMLGSMGGYQTFMPVDLKAGLYRIVEFAPRHLFGAYHFLFWVIAAGMLLTMRRKARALTLALIAVILLIPIVPVSGLLDMHYTWARYVFHLSVFLIFAGVLWGSEAMKEGRWKRAVAVLVLVAVVVLFGVRDREIKNFVYPERQIARQTAQEFLRSGSEYIKPAQVPYFYDWLGDIYEYLYGRKVSTKVVPEDALLPYLSKERREEILSSGYMLGPDKGAPLRENVLQGRVEMEGYKIKWKLGPYETGRYFMLRGRYAGMYQYITEVKGEGEYIFGRNYPDERLDFFYLKVLYRSPEGWEGISGEYRIQIPDNVRIDLEASR
jgi:hypothetical protein